jgi:hypothetical protein
MAKIEPNADIGPLLRSLSRIVTIDGERISWAGSELDSLQFTLLGALRFKQKIDDYNKDGCLWTTLNTCARNNNFSVGFFLQALSKELDQVSAGTSSPYTVISQINFGSFERFPPRMPSIHSSVRFLARLSKSVRSLLEKAEPWEQHRYQLVPNSCFLETTIRSTNKRDAIDKGYENLQFCLGLLNILTHGYGVGRRFGYPAAPLGVFLLRSSSVLVDRSSRELGNWFVEGQFPILYEQQFTAKWFKLDTEVVRAERRLRQIRATDYKDHIARAIILFQEGLSSNQIDTALLKLWGCIELICSGPNDRDPYDLVVKRAASIFSNVGATEIRLRFIADIRNKVVHRGEIGDHTILCAQWASVFAAQLIEFALMNIHDLRKHQDVLDYLSVTTNQERLKFEKKQLRRSLKLRDLRSKVLPKNTNLSE